MSFGMSVDQTWLFLLTVGAGVSGWLGNELWHQVKALRRDHDQLRVHIAENYVHQSRMEKALEPVMRKLDRLEDALRKQADSDEAR